MKALTTLVLVIGFGRGALVLGGGRLLSRRRAAMGSSMHTRVMVSSSGSKH